MIQTDIKSVDPTGREVVPDSNLRARVARASELLRADLEPVETFPIESRWRIVHQPGSAARVELDLTSEGVGVRNWVLDPTDWGDDAHIRRSLHGLVSAFGQAIAPNLRSDAQKALNDLKKFAALPLFIAGE